MGSIAVETRPEPNSALHGGYYADNFGDLLLLKIFGKWMKEGCDTQITYPGLPRYRRRRFLAHFPEASFGYKGSRRWRALVYAGGSIFCEPDTPRHFLKNWNIRFFLHHVFPAEVCLRNNVPYGIFGVDVGPLSNRWVRAETRRIFTHAAFVTVRDQESQDFVRTVFRMPKVPMIPDAALTISEAHISAGAWARVERALGAYKGRILLGIHQPEIFTHYPPESVILQKNLLSRLAQHRRIVPVLFADHGMSVGSEGHALADILREAGHDCLVLPFLGIEETMALIGRFSALVTPKLHVGVVAYSLGVYCESFAQHSKTIRFYKQIGRPAQCVLLKNIDEATADKKLTRVISAALNKDFHKDALWEKVREDAFMNQRMVSSFLRSC